MIKDMKLNDAASCRGGLLERPRYFPRQLMTPGEMTLEQDYFRQKLRQHNFWVHGWGVVCGALVCRVPKKPQKPGEPPADEPWLVRVQPGYALGPWGDDISIDCERTVDLRSPGTGGAPGEPAEQSRDPWCAEVHVPRDEGPLYVAIRYKEMPTRPVRVPPVGCGCDGTECEYSRWRDGYEIGILPDCPASHQGPPTSLEEPFEGPNPACPPCPTEPWVVLAEVTVGPGGAIEKIDNCSCRRLVASFGHFWWQCEAEPPVPPPVQPEPGQPQLVQPQPVQPQPEQPAEEEKKQAAKPAERKSKPPKPEK